MLFAGKQVHNTIIHEYIYIYTCAHTFSLYLHTYPYLYTHTQTFILFLHTYRHRQELEAQAEANFHDLFRQKCMNGIDMSKQQSKYELRISQLISKHENDLDVLRIDMSLTNGNDMSRQQSKHELYISQLDWTHKLENRLRKKHRDCEQEGLDDNCALGVAFLPSIIIIFVVSNTLLFFWFLLLNVCFSFCLRRFPV